MVRLVVGGNRSGKSACAAVEVARAACGCDPFGKYPKGPMRIYCVGKDQKHIGQVMYPLLFKEGAFKIIKDKKTGRWRLDREGSRKRRQAGPSSHPAALYCRNCLGEQKGIRSLGCDSEERYGNVLLLLQWQAAAGHGHSPSLDG